MRNIKSSMTGIFLITTRCGVTIAVVAIEIARIGRFTITAHAKLVAFGVGHHRVGSTLLCTYSHRSAYHQSAQRHFELHLFHVCSYPIFII